MAKAKKGPKTLAPVEKKGNKNQTAKKPKKK